MFRSFILFLFFLPTLAGAEPDIYIQVLGIAQDAGYPQANCYQPHCIRAWEDPELRRRTSSIVNSRILLCLPFRAAV